MIYGYARVSTTGQDKYGNSLDYQEKVLREAGAEKIYSDSYTGMKNTDLILTRCCLCYKKEIL